MRINSEVVTIVKFKYKLHLYREKKTGYQHGGNGKNKRRMELRKTRLAATQDYKTMKKDSDRTIRMAGLAATLNLEDILRPAL